MRRVDVRVLALALAGLGGAATAAVSADEQPLLRWRAPITVERSAAFVQLPLPAGAYAHSQQGGLRDLRVVDGRGENVPFALLAPRPDEAQRSETLHERPLYPLPPRPAGSEHWPLPLELSVDGERISVKRGAAAASAPAARPPGWVVDLGEPAQRPRDEAAPQALHLQWSGPAEFSVGYRLELSDDLRHWQPGGGGQLLSLASAGGALTQPRVPLPAAPARFVRLLWSDPDAAPQLGTASSVSVAQRQVALDEPTELQLAASPEPPSAAAAEPRALHFDLGAPLPLVQIDLQLPAGTQIAPLRLQWRAALDEPWSAPHGAVFYRIERGAETSRSPPLALERRARYLRVVPDPRAATLDAAQTRLIARVQLASVVFAAQGQPPYALLAGSAQAAAGALPLATLLPSLADERPRFGRAALGEWAEVEAAVHQAQTAGRMVRLRTGALWAVLLAGVAGLGWMVWRLARGAGAGRG